MWTYLEDKNSEISDEKLQFALAGPYTFFIDGSWSNLLVKIKII